VEIEERKKALLDYIILNNIKIITPTVENGIIVYPILKLAGLEDNDVEVLEKLEEEGLLFSELVLKVVRCPSCKSLSLLGIFKCPYCNSMDIKIKYIFKHDQCGFTGLDDLFEGNRCPLCLKDANKSNLRNMGQTYKCLSCNQTFITPSIFFQCINCGNIFTITNSETAPLYQYKVVEKKIEELKLKIEPILLIKELASKNGFKVKENEILKGNSGILHKFSLVLIKNDQVKVAIDFVDKLTLEYLMSSYVRKMDLSNIEIVIITYQEISDQNLYNIINVYGLNLFTLKNINDLLNKIEKLIGKFN
jgi:transposase-like protein